MIFNPPPGWSVPPGFSPPEGWVPDPSWPPAPPEWQFWISVPPPPRTSSATAPRVLSRRLKIAIGVGAFVILALTIHLIGRAVQNDGSEFNASERPVISTSDDWIASVCKPGTFVDGIGGGSNATGGAVCRTQSGRAPLIIQTYSSEFLLDDMVARLSSSGGGAYAKVQDDSGTWWLFRTGGGATIDDLAPLGEFGFIIDSFR